MRICATPGPLNVALKNMGHEVLLLDDVHAPQVLDLEQELARRNFSPDLVLQTEHLGQRVLLKGLSSLSCPKIFWSLDTHLNLSWQLPYMRLFDAVATPHASIMERLRVPHPPTLRLAKPGHDVPWRPHEQRGHSISFVGRFTSQRPLRKWLASFLEERYAAHIDQDVPFREMLELYADTRLAPNESILGEVNFRLMETVSCGCLTFSQNVGPDQDALFEPGREIMLYENVLELESLLDHFLEHPESAERKARRAWERLRAEHLPRHRAQALLDFVQETPLNSATGSEAKTAFWCCIWNLYRAERFSIQPDVLENALATLPQTAEVQSARLAFLVFRQRLPEAARLAATLLAAEVHPHDLEFNLHGSTVGLLAEQWKLAKQFWLRHCRAMKKNLEPPASPQHLLLLWAKVLTREDALATPGFTYDPGRHLPASAVECLYLAQEKGPQNLELTRQMDALFAQLKGSPYFRLGTLSELTLHERGNWRYGLSLGLINLQSFRRKQGIEEVTLAWRTAREQGKENAFFRVLDGMEPKGLALAAIKGVAAQREAPRRHASDSSPEPRNHPES